MKRMLVLDIRTDMACILENECPHARLFMCAFRDKGRAQAASVITIGQGV